MPRIVVTTAGGDPVAPDAELVGRVVELIETMPDLPLDIEWEELPREQHASLLIQAAQVRGGHDAYGPGSATMTRQRQGALGRSSQAAPDPAARRAHEAHEPQVLPHRGQGPGGRRAADGIVTAHDDHIAGATSTRPRWRRDDPGWGGRGRS